MAILDRLNTAQRQAAEIVDGPLLVLAGAGAGKTRVLTHRIAYLVEEIGIPPWNILAVTFTNKAAEEMRSRVEELVGGEATAIRMGTFHSVCARLLRFEAAGFGIDANFTIYDEDDRQALMRRLLKALGIAEEELAPRALIAQISRAKNAMIDPRLFAREESSPRKKRIAEIYSEYEAELRRNNAFDFDDLLVKLVHLLGRHGHILAKYQQRFKYILIDEYQDTNRPQYLLTRQLAAGHHNICCVGDDDQSIYQFRGADIRNILDFERDYPETRVVRLEQNYRSTGRILAAANAVIRNNRDRKGKTLWTESESGEPVEVVECSTDRCEARYVVDTLRDLAWKEGYAPADAAVLYRTNAQSPASRGRITKGRHGLRHHRGSALLRAQGNQGYPCLPPPPGQSGRRHQPAAHCQHPEAGNRLRLGGTPATLCPATRDKPLCRPGSARTGAGAQCKGSQKPGVLWRTAPWTHPA